MANKFNVNDLLSMLGMKVDVKDFHSKQHYDMFIQRSQSILQKYGDVMSGLHVLYADDDKEHSDPIIVCKTQLELNIIRNVDVLITDIYARLHS